MNFGKLFQLQSQIFRLAHRLRIQYKDFPDRFEYVFHQDPWFLIVTDSFIRPFIDLVITGRMSNRVYLCSCCCINDVKAWLINRGNERAWRVVGVVDRTITSQNKIYAAVPGYRYKNTRLMKALINHDTNPYNDESF